MRTLTASLFLFSLFCLCACDPAAESEQADLRQENARLRAVADSLEQQLVIARQEGSRDSAKAADQTLLSSSDMAYLKSRGLKDPEEDLKRDLLQNKTLIPQEGVLGGTMYFTPEGVQVMNRKWVLAYFEDGHNAGSALLTYSIKNGIITWKVIHSELL